MGSSNKDNNSKKHQHAHHFDSVEHEFDASKFGIWVFLCTEILMFGGLFVGYIFYSNRYPEIFEAGSQFLDWKLGAINTAVLLLSSFTIAISIRNIQMKQKKAAIRNMIITLLCGCVFMGIKYKEYTHKFHQGIYPGKYFDYKPHGAEHSKAPEGVSKKAEKHGDDIEHMDKLPENIALYFSFYFVMTGIHGTHVIIGMGLILWCLIRTRNDEFDPEYYTPLEGAALFWHLVDLVWIYLFPLLYLI